MNPFLLKLICVLTFLTMFFPSMTFDANAFQISGKGADAVFYKFEGCIEQIVFVGLSDLSERPREPGAPKPSPFAFVTIFRSNFCTGTTELEASGGATLTDEQFAVRNDLSSAYVKATFELLDRERLPLGTVNLDLQWNAIGDVSRNHCQRTLSFPLTTTIRRHNGADRPAEVTGTVSIGADNIISGADYSAFISSASDGYVSINRNNVRRLP